MLSGRQEKRFSRLRSIATTSAWTRRQSSQRCRCGLASRTKTNRNKRSRNYANASTKRIGACASFRSAHQNTMVADITTARCGRYSLAGLPWANIAITSRRLPTTTCVRTHCLRWMDRPDTSQKFCPGITTSHCQQVHRIRSGRRRW